MIKKIIKKVLKALPPKNYIIFESVPDVSDNAKAVFDEILLRGMNKKYKCIWIVYDKNKVRQKYKNVSKPPSILLTII